MKQLLLITLVFSVTNAIALTPSEEAAESLICVYGEKYGGSNTAECKAPLKRFYDIEKKTGGLTKKFSCGLTKAARKAYLAQAEGNEWPLSDIVNCSRK